MRRLITLLKEKSVNWNKGVDAIKIPIANVKLKQYLLPNIPDEFASFLKIFNGVSNNGALIFGVEVGNVFFIDLVEYNKTFFKNTPTKKIILGYNDTSYLVYDAIDKKYHIVKKDSFESEISSTKIDEPISHLLKLTSI